MTHSYKKSEMLISNIREILKQRKVPMDTQYEIAIFLKKCPESKLTRMSTMSDLKLVNYLTEEVKGQLATISTVSTAFTVADKRRSINNNFYHLSESQTRNAGMSSLYTRPQQPQVYSASQTNPQQKYQSQAIPGYTNPEKPHTQSEYPTYTHTQSAYPSNPTSSFAAPAPEAPTQIVQRKVPGEPVGFKNVQNICYLNTLLQTFFHIPRFVETILYLDFDDTEINKELEIKLFKPFQ
jgi:hypothetical protein